MSYLCSPCDETFLFVQVFFYLVTLIVTFVLHIFAINFELLEETISHVQSLWWDLFITKVFDFMTLTMIFDLYAKNFNFVITFELLQVALSYKVCKLN